MTPVTSMAANSWELLWALGAFILVLIILVLALKGLGRLSRFKGAKGRQPVFELRGIQPLDNRKYLAAVEVEGRFLVLGVTPDRITPLAHWFIDDGDSGQPGQDFKLPAAEEDDSPLDISVADLGRDIK